MDSLSYEANLFPLFTPCLIFLSPSLSHITVDRVRERAECYVIPDLSEIAMQLNTDTIQHLILCQLWGRKVVDKRFVLEDKKKRSKDERLKGRKKCKLARLKLQAMRRRNGSGARNFAPIANGAMKPSLV